MVLAIGNPDRGDDGIGAAVVNALQGRLPPGVTICAAGDDPLSLIEEWGRLAALVCVDAAASLGAPGRIHRLDLGDELRDELGADPGTREPPPRRDMPSSHAFGLIEAIDLARVLGLAPKHVVLFAVEGACFDPGAGLSPAVAESVTAAGAAVLDEVSRLRRDTFGAENPARA